MKIKNIKNILAAGAVFGLMSVAATSCSDSYMEDMNIDESKASSIEPGAQLTTALLQTYGDFGLMDTYRSYITGFTQHFAGGWNVTNYGGSVHANDDEMRHIWDQYYSVAIKNLVDAIANSEDKPAVNAALRIHRVYLMSVLTDTYGDIPCSEAGMGFISGISNPKYDKQEDIYNFFFEELASCVAQLGETEDRIGGDVTSLSGDALAWRKYANSLRLRFAMRISDVNPTKAQEEFEKALKADGGYIQSAAEDAYIIYTDGPFTLYEGSRDLDFRVNALGEILYGQDPTSPTFVSSTFYNLMEETSDPRLYRICRHYINTIRSQIKPDREWNVDVTDEVISYVASLSEKIILPCDPGAAWYNNWINAPSNDKISTLERLVKTYPEVGFDGNNFPARMLRPFLSIDMEMPDRPGFLISSAEVEFLLAEAKSKGWAVDGDVETHFTNGINASMQILNTHYLESNKISESEIQEYIDGILAEGTLASNPREAINTQAWILHTMNPAEGWANLRRSDYPVLQDRAKLGKFDGFTYDDGNLQTPVRLCYPILEAQYNSANYKQAVDNLGGTDDWHHRLWWDTEDINVK
ncbi:MAG: SusD/RagB family nutrient-binding outer membrane lipoprotein [Bacteroidales bacterium]|nr:SusD/RagB family nutrient-binding outer membrane lipoprotein [Bacteroidales bacterium]